MAVVLKTSGSFKNVTKYLRMENKLDKIRGILDEYGKRGVEALSAATPVGETHKTAQSWRYEIDIDSANQRAALSFWNDNVAYPKGTYGTGVGKRGEKKGKRLKNKGAAPIALLLQYGHATATGGYVEGRDYINPVLQPLFDEMADQVWKEVTKV